jgi:two-component system response regulator PrrA
MNLGTVLVIDDDRVTTETFARMLRLEGFQVRTALNAESGLKASETAHPDAIILDLRMPLVDGLGFLYRLRAHEEHQDTPVAIVTGDYALEDLVAQELTNLGAQIHFKPLWLDDLIALAHSLLAAERRLGSHPPVTRH